MSRTSVRLTVLVVVAAGLAAAGTVLLFRLRESRLNALFEGECEESTETRDGFYSGMLYNLEDYLPAAETGESPTAPVRRAGPSLLDKPEEKEDWERSIDAMHQTWKLDAATGATKVARLLSPTTYRERWVPRFLTITYPPDGAVFPPNLCAPTVEWSDANNNLWRLTITAGNPENPWTWSTVTSQRRLRIPDDVWQRVRELAANDGQAVLQVKGVRLPAAGARPSETPHRSRPVTFRISKDPADSAIVYRLVDPPFINKKTPDMFVRDIRERRPRLFLGAHQQYCLNCHTFSSKTGRRGKLGLQVRYLGDQPIRHYVYFSVYDIETQRGRKIILPFEVQMTTFMGWSPDGTKLAFSANQKIATFSPIVFETQWAGQPTSDIAVYSTEEQAVRLVSGACDPKVLEIYPCWTPDGQSIVYSSVKAGLHPTRTQFDLMVIPYSDGRGGTPVPVRGACRNGKSNFYARFSPDGRWMSFVQADYGSLIKASSDIWILPGSLEGEAKPLACNAPFAADSWHSWSSNSRWLVFASKRDDGIFARLYLTHIDETGLASPAVRLPIDEPMIGMSFNIPEFLAEVPPIDGKQLYREIGRTSHEVLVKSEDDEEND